jgi:Methyltransferase domain
MLILQPTLPLNIPSAFADRVASAAVFLVSFVATLTWAADARVPYVPTPQSVVDRMLETAKVGPNDYLIDLGSGDGRIVVTAAKRFGTRGFGVDLNPERIKESNENARAAGVTDKVAFHQRNLFETDLSQATVITMYLLPRVNVELRPQLLELAPGTRLVSHDFDMGDWKADTELTVDAKDKYGGTGGKSDIYFWIVPARAAGVWQWQMPVAGKPQSYEIRLEQKYQVITGSVWVGGRTATLQGARLRGSEIRFAFTADVNGGPVKHEFTGKIDGDAINGSAEISGERVRAQRDWNARRAPRAAASLSNVSNLSN